MFQRKTKHASKITNLAPVHAKQRQKGEQKSLLSAQAYITHDWPSTSGWKNVSNSKLCISRRCIFHINPIPPVISSGFHLEEEGTKYINNAPQHICVRTVQSLLKLLTLLLLSSHRPCSPEAVIV